MIYHITYRINYICITKLSLVVCWIALTTHIIHIIGTSMKRDPRDVILPFFKRLEEPMHSKGFDRFVTAKWWVFRMSTRFIIKHIIVLLQNNSIIATIIIISVSRIIIIVVTIIIVFIIILIILIIIIIILINIIIIIIIILIIIIIIIIKVR